MKTSALKLSLTDGTHRNDQSGKSRGDETASKLTTYKCCCGRTRNNSNATMTYVVRSHADLNLACRILHVRCRCAQAPSALQRLTVLCNSKSTCHADHRELHARICNRSWKIPSRNIPRKIPARNWQATLLCSHIFFVTDIS